MNSTNIARKINERRQRPNPIMTTGEILTTIGSEGMQEALQRRWLVPDTDTGYLMVNMNAGKLAEIAEACRCPACHELECKCVCEPPEEEKNKMPSAMREAWNAMGVGSTSNNGPQGQMPMMPHAQPVAPTTPPAKKPQIGANVAAVEMQDGKEKLYPGTVSGVGQDGRYRLDFGAGERPPMDREYGPEQLRFVEPANA